MIRRPPRSTLFPSATRFRSASHYLLVPQAVVTPVSAAQVAGLLQVSAARGVPLTFRSGGTSLSGQATADRKSTRLNSSHANISYAVYCLKKKQRSVCARVV